MSTQKVLKQLHGLDRTSSQFHKHLSSFLRSEGYRGAVPNLQGEDLAWLVDYLESVSLQTISPKSPPNTVLGSDVYFKPCEPRVPGILARTEEYLRRQGDPTEIPYAFKFPPGHRTPASFRARPRGDFEDTDSTRENASQRRLPDVQDRAFFMTLSPCLGSKDSQAFYQMAAVWKNLAHPNVVPLLGVTIDPIQLVSGWMPDTDLTGYITNNPDADRLSLVGVPSTVPHGVLTPPLVI